MKGFSFVKGRILCAQSIGDASGVLRAICRGLGIVPDWIVKRDQVTTRGTYTFKGIDSRRLTFKLQFVQFCIFQKGSKVKTKIYTFSTKICIVLNLKRPRNE